MKARQRQLNDKVPKQGPVIFWISRDQRAADHWGLYLAQQEAIRLQVPMLVIFCLKRNDLNALSRTDIFMLEGLTETARELDQLRIPFFLVEGDELAILPVFCQILAAGALYSDFSALRQDRQVRGQLSRILPLPMFEVDSHNLIPCWETVGKAAYAAYTFRPTVNRQLNAWLEPVPAMIGHPFPLVRETVLEQLEKAGLVPIRPEQVLSQYKCQGEDMPRAGHESARQRLDHFVKQRLSCYHQRNDPNKDSCSLLSPWLHFGQISARQVVEAVRTATASDPDQDQGLGPEGPLLQNQADFLEELVVRRELSDNFCFYNPLYDQFAGFPEWARKTLDQHREDPRPFIYDDETFDQGRTDDPLWNAAQCSLVHFGYMHGYLRMYWAKKILEWTPDPETALATAIALNDRYLLDGRDPNGYVGIAWSIGGVHDRAWSERLVFGKIRYMSYQGCRRKFDVDAYIRRITVERVSPFQVQEILPG